MKNGHKGLKDFLIYKINSERINPYVRFRKEDEQIGIRERRKKVSQMVIDKLLRKTDFSQEYVLVVTQNSQDTFLCLMISSTYNSYDSSAWSPDSYHLSNLITGICISSYRWRRTERSKRRKYGVWHGLYCWIKWRGIMYIYYFFFHNREFQTRFISLHPFHTIA